MSMLKNTTNQPIDIIDLISKGERLDAFEKGLEMGYERFDRLRYFYGSEVVLAKKWMMRDEPFKEL